MNWQVLGGWAAIENVVAFFLPTMWGGVWVGEG